MATLDPNQVVLYCPHCGNRSVQTRLLTQPYTDIFYTVPEGVKSEEPSLYTVARCETCDELLVYTEHEHFADSSETPFGDLQFPRQSALTDAVPSAVRDIYKEAQLVKALSPTAYVILARRVLEEICIERGVIAPNLAKSLEKLAADGVIPHTLSEATTLIRLVGNAGAHAGPPITMLQVWAIDDFIKAVIEYIYIAPAKIDDFKKKFSHFTDKGPKAPSATTMYSAARKTPSKRKLVPKSKA